MELWKDFCEKFDLVSNGQVVTNRMAAPSGPIGGRVAMLWYYPTDRSSLAKPIGVTKLPDLW